jgi:hypothetical protein
MKKLLKKPVFLAVSIAIASLIISYIGNQLPALKDLLQANNSQDVAKIFAENEIAIAFTNGRTNRQGSKSAKRRLEEDNAFDALFEDGDVEVDEEGKGVFGHF